MIERRTLLHSVAPPAIGWLYDPSLPYDFAKSIAAVADVCARSCWWPTATFPSAVETEERVRQADFF